MKRFAIAIASAAVATLALTGCSAGDKDDAKPSASASPTAEAQTAKGYKLTAMGNASETGDGAVIVTGLNGDFEWVHADVAPKITLTSIKSGYTCQVEDSVDDAAAKKFANGDLTAGKEFYMKEANGNAFVVNLKDRVTGSEVHRFAAPKDSGKGIMLSCFGKVGQASLDSTWEWLTTNMDVVSVSAAKQGTIAGPSEGVAKK